MKKLKTLVLALALVALSAGPAAAQYEFFENSLTQNTAWVSQNTVMLLSPGGGMLSTTWQTNQALVQSMSQNSLTQVQNEETVDFAALFSAMFGIAP